MKKKLDIMIEKKEYADKTLEELQEMKNAFNHKYLKPKDENENDNE